MTRGQRNNNPLNIRKGNNWKGEHPTQSDTEFEVFVSPEYGFRAAFRIIHNGFKATPPRNTIRQIVGRWAPPNENNTERYINIVSTRTGIHPDTVLSYHNKATMIDIVLAMAHVETGVHYDRSTCQNGYMMEAL